jgi:hypothetical protein
MTGKPVLSRLRRPEYTGARRCWSCTVVNAAILGVVAIALGFVVAPVAGVAVAVAGAATIWLRGYLVPGTPAVAPRLVAAVPGGERVFGKSPPAGRTGSLGASAGTPDGEQLLGVLVEAGVVDVDGEQVLLGSAFEAAWDDRMASLSSLSTDDLAGEVEDALTDVVRDESTVPDVRVVRDDDAGKAWVVLSTGERVVDETWVPRPVAIAETAALRQLAGSVDDSPIRRAGATSLRMFIEECPDCGTTVEESTAVSCCGGYYGEGVPEETLVCPACDVRLFTFD